MSVVRVHVGEHRGLAPKVAVPGCHGAPVLPGFFFEPSVGLELAFLGGAAHPMSEFESPSERTAGVVLSRLTNPAVAVGDAGWIPAWSSLVLEKTVGQLLDPPASQIGDLFRGLWTHLAETNASLTPTMSNFWTPCKPSEARADASSASPREAEDWMFNTRPVTATRHMAASAGENAKRVEHGATSEGRRCFGTRIT
jgi:hypothetical protein